MATQSSWQVVVCKTDGAFRLRFQELDGDVAKRAYDKEKQDPASIAVVLYGLDGCAIMYSLTKH